MRKFTGISLIAGLLLTVAACNRVPKHVLPPDRMALLMADMRMADAVVTSNPDDYPSEASKLILKKAVYLKNGVTAEQFDTSLVWYGHNIDKYQEVTEKSIEILEKRMKEVNALAAGEAALSVAGDSVDLWNGPETYVFRRDFPGRFITFAMDSDANWERGDIYTMRTHGVTQAVSSSWGMTMIYADGTMETAGSSFSTANPNRQELVLHTDSSRVPVRISGWIKIDPDLNRPAIIDSISLTRRRVDPMKYVARRYEQRRIIPREIKKTEDSIARSKGDTVPQQRQRGAVRVNRNEKNISPASGN